MRVQGDHMQTDSALARAERTQGVMRFSVMLAILVWIGIAHYFDILPPGAWQKILVIYAIFNAGAVVLWLWARKRPSNRPGRVLVRHLLDYGSLSSVIVIGGEALVPASAALIWVTVGNGLRFGSGALLAAGAAAMFGFAAITYFNAYWWDHWVFGVSFGLVGLLVPIYVFIMLRRLERAHEATEELSRSKSRFLAYASHDLRQPIHAISLFTSCLRDAGLKPREVELVDNIDRSLESVSRLFKSLLDVSTLDSGKVAPRLEAFALQDVIDDLVQQNSTACEQAGIDVRWVATAVWVETDRSLLTTMLQNVVNNAIKYAPDAPILIGCRRAGKTVSVEIFDRGPGIAAEHQERVFDEFYQVRERGDRDVQGVGLGLPIVRRMATLLGLTTLLRSRPGGGTRFVVGGLRVVEPRAVEARGSAQAARPGSAMEGLRVLLVEDDKAVLLATASLLTRWGCEVETWTVIPTHRVECDLLITDYDLGQGATGKDCIETVRRLNGHNVPAVVTSGHDPDRVREEIGDNSIPLLSKPVRPAELRSVVLASAIDPLG